MTDAKRIALQNQYGRSTAGFVGDTNSKQKDGSTDKYYGLPEEFKEIVKLPITDLNTKEVVTTLDDIAPTNKDVFNNVSVSTVGSTKVTTAVELPISTIESIGKDVSDDQKLYQDILEEFPDIELGLEILASMIVAPNDLQTVSLNIDSSNEILPHQSLIALNQVVSSIVNTDVGLNLQTSLTTKVNEILIKGAYITAYVSPQQIKEFANGVSSNESYVSPTTVTTDLDVSSYIANLLTVTSDPTELMVGEELIKTSNENFIPYSTSEYYERGTHDDSKARKIRELTNMLKPNYALDIKDNSTSIVMKLPIESVIPGVHKNDPSNHLVYYVLLDNDGFPISTKEETEMETEDIIKSLITQAKESGVSNNAKLQRTIKQNIPTEVINQLIDNELYSLAIRPEHKRVLAKSTIDTIYKTVFARIAAGRGTKVLVLPKESVSYLALEYHDNGIGKSKLAGMGEDAADRLILNTVTNVAVIKGATPTYNYNIKLDPADPHPKKSMKRFMGLIAANNQKAYPSLVLNRDDVTDWLHNSGKVFNFKHPQLPDVELDLDIRQQQITPPDEDREKRLSKKMYSRMSLTPEIIDSAFEADFASTGIANKALLAKRAVSAQTVLEPQLAALISMYVKAHGVHLTTLTEVLEDSLKGDVAKEFREKLKESDIPKEHVYERIINDYLNHITVLISKPENPGEGLVDKYRAYTDDLEDYVETYLSEDALAPGMTDGEIESIETLKLAIKGSLQRDWMRKNGHYSEIADIFTKAKDGKANVDIVGEYSAFLENAKEIASGFAKLKPKEEDEGPEETNEESDDRNENSEDDNTGEDNGDTTENVDDDALDEDPDAKDEEPEDKDDGETNEESEDKDNGEDDGEEETEDSNLSLDNHSDLIPSNESLPRTFEQLLIEENIVEISNQTKYVPELSAIISETMGNSNTTSATTAAVSLISMYRVFTRNGAYVLVAPKDDAVKKPIRYKSFKDRKLIQAVRKLYKNKQ